MSAECDTHGTDLLWDNDGDGPTYCPSCHLDTLTAQRERLLTLAGRIKDYECDCGDEPWMAGRCDSCEARAIIEEIRKEDAQ
jgi:hypothetical protein